MLICLSGGTWGEKQPFQRPRGGSVLCICGQQRGKEAGEEWVGRGVMAELTVTGHILVHCMDVALTIGCLSGKAFSTFLTLVSLPCFHSPLSHLSQSTAFILCHHAYSPSCCLFLLLPFLLPSPGGLYTQIMRPHSFISYSVSSMMH